MPLFGREKDEREQIHSSGPPHGQIRIVVVGDSGGLIQFYLEAHRATCRDPRHTIPSVLAPTTTSDISVGSLCEFLSGSSSFDPGGIDVSSVASKGVGKTSLVHLILEGSSIAHPRPTIGCAVGVKHISYASAGISSNSLESGVERGFFIELWDISGHDRYKDCRSLFYTEIHGVIFVHDLSQRRTRTRLHNWAEEIASSGTFSAPLVPGGPGGLTIPYLIIANKADTSSNQRHESSGNLVDVARMWVEKQGLLPPSEEIPLTDSFSSSASLFAAAKEARYDKEAVMKFFRKLIRRRYFPDEQSTPPNPWPMPPLTNPQHFLGGDQVYENQFYGGFRDFQKPYHL